MAVYPEPTSITGTVASVNPKGVKLDPHGEWFNYSRFAADLVPPERGQTVTLTMDRQGFIRSVETAETGPGATLANRTAPGASSVARDRTITRLAVLKAAAEFGAARPSLKSGDVLAIAESWERWILREQDNTVELIDAV